ncbi:putative leucine-rich repeat receptor-like serine/threonine-protein kinase [Camellia lanceoleosa]|uniref:Leucine-rich repeat receptor-like serine/threonine-protein kinase n=1 Tax=Camellia lanceoleosa TaxID=1840588 RepID=A0ACC0GY98_9ERIC|nr:putative leucine-rich repeat receptor-like serine/threonine-protein kinase [Camellia lanceoleosa]
MEMEKANMIHSFPLPASVILDLDVFQTNPWDLPGDSKEKRYFFCKRSKKNVNKCKGITGSGYWKAMEIGNCSGLWNLALYNNQFTGEIPFSITNASLMYSLDVEDNHLKGELPSEIVANLFKLSYLHLSYNDMVGHDNNSNLVSFFTALKNCMILDELELADMDLGGRLSSSIGQLVASTSWSFDLSNNRLSGEIPKSLGDLVQLNFMFLNHNLLTGAIPLSLGQCMDISKLDLSHNRLTGNIPPEISNLQEIRIFLNLSHNHLEGPLPIELSKLENVQEIDLSSNNLTGSIFP